MLHLYKPKISLTIPIIKRSSTTPKILKTITIAQPSKIKQTFNRTVISQTFNKTTPLKQLTKQPVKQSKFITNVKTPIRLPRPSTVPNRQKIDLNKRNKPILIKTLAGSNYNNIARLKGIGKGRILIMLAAGPSLSEVDLIPLKEHPLIDFMCINKPVEQIWPSKFWSFADQTQYLRNQSHWDTYNGIIINSPNVTARKGNQVIIMSRPGRGFSLDLTHGYHIGRSSTYASMQVAIYMDYSSIFVFGLDMCEVGGRTWWYGNNPDVGSDIRKQRFLDEAQHYLYAAQNLTADIKNRFYICSAYNPHKFTEYFTKWDHKEAVSKILEIAGPIDKNKSEGDKNE